VSLMYGMEVGTGNNNEDKKDNITFFSEVPVIKLGFRKEEGLRDCREGSIHVKREGSSTPTETIS